MTDPGRAGSGPSRSPDPVLRAGPLAFVEDLARPVLDEGDHHHLGRVLRLRPGAPMVVADGAGRWRCCRFDREPEPTGPVQEESPSRHRVAVGIAPVKGERTEWAVQKLTELGVEQVVVLEAERSVVRWSGERAERQLGRLRRVAREAAMQARRPRLPEVVGPVAVGAAVDAGTVLADPVGDPGPGPGVRAVLVGPEGGWSEGERALAPTCSLGPTVLRTETAALAAAVLLVAGRDGKLTGC